MKPKVLILEDNQVYAKVLARSLEYKQYDVLIENFMDDFINTAEMLQPDFVIMDLMLGSESSLPLVAPLRKLLPKTKILILTGYASIATTVQAIKLGADDYIPKPATTNSILKAMVGSNLDNLQPEAISVERLEWEHIQRVLEEQKGNVSATARILGMHRRTLQRKLSKRPPSKKTVDK